MSEEQAPTAQIEIGGIKFTGGKAMLVITALTSAVYMVDLKFIKTIWT